MHVVHSDNRIVVWLGLATFAWLMLFVWQGLDFTDMGYWLTGYQQLYTNPDTIWASCWLTYVIGHWVGLALGGDVLAYKLGYVVVVTTTAIIAYRLLAFQLGHSFILASMMLLTVFLTRGNGGNWIGYNELTALFYIAGAALLFLGLVSNGMLLVVLAGVVLGANIFVRFPNFLGITLVTAIWLHAWAYRLTLRGVVLRSSWFLGGFMLGAVLIFGLIVLHGHKSIYYQGIQTIFNLAVNTNSHHSGAGLIKNFIRDHVRAFSEALTLVIIVGWVANWVSKQKITWASVTILSSALLLFYIIYVRGHWAWCIPGICYVVLLSIVFLEMRKNTTLALLAYIAGMVLLLTPLGSNNGINNSIFGMWLALPLTLIWLWRRSNFIVSLWFKVSGDEFKSNGKVLIEIGGGRVFAIIILLALLFQSLTTAWLHTYLDSENHLSMTTSIEHPLLAGTFTTAERAKVITELLEAMSHFTKPGDEVLAYNAIPTLHFLTKTHPWLGDPWPDFADSEKIAALIRQKEQAGARLPCIVRAKYSTYSNSWPLEAKPLSTWQHQEEPRRIFAEFELRHGYIVAWSNDFFQILTAAQ